MIPESVRDAARAAKANRDVSSAHAPVGARGEIGVLRNSVGPTPASRVLSRLGIVVARHDSTSTLTIHLATNEVEQATDLDLILDGDTEGLAFPLVLQSELYGPIFEEQLQESLTYSTLSRRCRTRSCTSRAR